MQMSIKCLLYRCGRRLSCLTTKEGRRRGRRRFFPLNNGCIMLPALCIMREVSRYRGVVRARNTEDPSLLSAS